MYRVIQKSRFALIGFTVSKKRATAYVMIQGCLASVTEDSIFEEANPDQYGSVGAQQGLLGQISSQIVKVASQFALSHGIIKKI
jgi:hypothetical protein